MKELTLKELYLIDDCVVSVINTFENLEIDVPQNIEKVNKKITQMIKQKEKENESSN